MEKILSSRIHRKKLQYKVHWKGYDKNVKYYDAEGFKGSPHKLRQYHAEYPDRPGPLKNLETWLIAYENGEEAVDEKDDNTTVKS